MRETCCHKCKRSRPLGDPNTGEGKCPFIGKCGGEKCEACRWVYQCTTKYEKNTTRLREENLKACELPVPPKYEGSRGNLLDLITRGRR